MGQLHDLSIHTLAPLESPVLGGAFLCRLTACAAPTAGWAQKKAGNAARPAFHRSTGTTGDGGGGRRLRGSHCGATFEGCHRRPVGATTAAIIAALP